MSYKCDPEEYLVPVKTVLREDLESLARTYTEDERVELWNEIREMWRKYLRECSVQLPEDLDKLVRGKFRFAQLLLAASFRINNEEYPNITKMFKDEEYKLLERFEEMKILDHLSIDEIVEFIRRKEGKVYEIVMKYYQEQLYMFDTSWAPLIGDLAKIFNQRYRNRRRKIEEAVIEYTKRHGILTVVSEIEEAVKKVLEAGEFKRKMEEELRRKIEEELGLKALEEKLALLEEERERLNRHIRELEGKLLEEASSKAELVAELERLKSEKSRLVEDQESLASKLARAEEELKKAMEELRSKEEELRKLAAEKSHDKAVVETLTAEAETLKSLVEKLGAQTEEYREALERVKTEKSLIEARLAELESALRGESEGHVVTSEDARALEEVLVRRINKKLGDGAIIFDPLSKKERKIKWDRIEYISIAGEEEPGLPKGKGITLIKRRGIIFRKRDIVVEGISLVHRESYREKGWDSKPVSLSEILDILEARVDQAEKGNYYHLLILASPTGFTSKAIEYLNSNEFHRNFTARHVSLYLVDPITGQVIYNKADDAASKNLEIAEPLLPEDKIKKVKDFVLSDEARRIAYTNTSVPPLFIRLDQIASYTKESPDIIRRALSELEAQGIGKVAVTKNNIVAFFYNK